MSTNRLGAALTQGRPRAGLFLLFGAVASVVLLVVEGAGSPSSVGPWTPPFRHFDKVLHAAAHGWLTTLLIWGLALLPAIIKYWPDHQRRMQRLAASAVGFDLLAGLCVELVQKWLGRAHGRQFDTWDIVANQAGSGVAIILFLAVAVPGLRAYTGAD